MPGLVQKFLMCVVITLSVIKLLVHPVKQLQIFFHGQYSITSGKWISHNRKPVCESNDHVSTPIDNIGSNNAAWRIKFHCLSFMNGLKRVFQVSAILFELVF